MPYRPTYAGAYTMTSPIKAYADGDNFTMLQALRQRCGPTRLLRLSDRKEQLKGMGWKIRRQPMRQL